MQIHECNTFDKLRTASDASATSDLFIVLTAPFSAPQKVYFPTSTSSIHIIGIGKGTKINVNQTFDNDWSGNKITGGLFVFQNRLTTIRNVDFTGLESAGSVIKFETGATWASVTDCTFDRIGIAVFPHKVNPPVVAQDSIYTQCISGHDLSMTLVISECNFYKCSSNEHRWAHCIYSSVQNLLISDNKFTECGNPFAVGSKTAGYQTVIQNNKVIRPALCGYEYYNAGEKNPAYLLNTDLNTNLTFTHNQIGGTYFRPWNGKFNPDKHIIDYNDYSGMQIKDQDWFVSTGEGRFGFEEWKNRGFDTHSIPLVT